MAVCSRFRPDLTPELVGVKFLSRPVRLPKLTHYTGESHTMVTFRALSMRGGGETQKFSGVTPIRRPCQDAPDYLAQIRVSAKLRCIWADNERNGSLILGRQAVLPLPRAGSTQTSPKYGEA